MKKILIILISVISLSGCAWGNSDQVNNNMSAEQKTFVAGLSSKKDNNTAVTQDLQKTDQSNQSYDNIISDNIIQQDAPSAVSNLKEDSQNTSIATELNQINSTSTTQAKSSFTELTEKKSSITVIIKDVQKKNNQTIVMLTLDNHSYDLSSMDIKGISRFNDVKPIDFKINTTEMGGHHIGGNMIFSGDLKGDLRIGLKDDLIFNFKIK